MKEKFVLVPASVMVVLHECTIGNQVLHLPSRPLGKKLYGQVKEFLKKADGQWNISRQCFLFTVDATERLQQAIKTGKMVHRRTTFQEFFTPSDLADKLAELVIETCRFRDLSDDTTLRILEPSAGNGSLVHALLSRFEWCNFLYDIKIVACEIQEENLKQITDPRVRKVNTDFLACVVPAAQDGGYHAVLMNPPFDNDTWAKHVQHALAFLDKGGTLVAVVPRTASLAKLAIPMGAKAFLTPVKAKFGDTGVKVSIFTYGINKELVDTVLRSIVDKTTDTEETEETEELQSPEYYLREVKRLNKEVERTINALERELRSCCK